MKYVTLFNSQSTRYFFVKFGCVFCFDQCPRSVHQALDIRFIEYMPFDGNHWNLEKFIPYSAMLSKVMAKWPQLTRLVDHPNDTSKVARYAQPMLLYNQVIFMPCRHSKFLVI